MRRVVADVVVIGAGIMGCSAAFHLARLKGTRVIVVEKGSLCAGMTKRSGGMIRTNFALESEARLAIASLGYFREWKDRVGGNCGFTTTGFVTVAGEGADAETAREHATALTGMGANVQILSPDALRELEPFAHVDDIAVAVYEPDAGYADPLATTNALAARGKDLGVTFQTGTHVKRILVERGRVFGVDTNTGEIETLSVVLAAGPWSDRLLKPWGIEIGIRPELTQIAFFDRPMDIKQGHLAYQDLVTGAYFRPHTYGLTQAGLNHSDVFAVANPDRLEESIHPDFTADVKSRLSKRLPIFDQARYVRGHTGIYDMTPDLHPVLAHAPGIHGLVVAAGFSGFGFSLAPAAGACIAEMVTEGNASTVNVEALSFSRFQNLR